DCPPRAPPREPDRSMSRAIHGDAASVFLDRRRIGSRGGVLVRALISLPGRHVVLHFAQVSGLVPPWWLEVLPHECQNAQSRNVKRQPHGPSSYSHCNQQSEWNTKAQQP